MGLIWLVGITLPAKGCRMVVTPEGQLSAAVQARELSGSKTVTELFE